jgi:phosphoribosylformylglycinamidine (FGAM) synthase PurS component
MRFKCTIVAVYKDGVPNPLEVRQLEDIQTFKPSSVRSIQSGKLFEVTIEVDDRNDISELLANICQSFLVNENYEECQVLKITPESNGEVYYDE